MEDTLSGFTDQQLAQGADLTGNTFDTNGNLVSPASAPATGGSSGLFNWLSALTGLGTAGINAYGTLAATQNAQAAQKTAAQLAAANAAAKNQQTLSSANLLNSISGSLPMILLGVVALAVVYIIFKKK